MANILVITKSPTQVQVPTPLKDYQVISSTVKGRAKARNDLAKKAQAPYLLFIDDDVEFDGVLWSNYLQLAIEKMQIVGYTGENDILCTRVFGIPRKVFDSVDGFDESFDVGEDMEMGLNLLKRGYDFIKIPNELVKHRSHQRTSNWFTHFVVRARLALRYKKPKLLFPPKRKVAPLGTIVTILAFCRYIFSNKRVGLNVRQN